MLEYTYESASSIAKGIYSIIDYFQNHTPKTEPKHDLRRLAGRYANLWSMTDIVVTGDKVVATYPDTWRPLGDPEELEELAYIDETTLKVTNTGSFYSEGELVHFNLKDGRVESVVYNGTTMWPAERWLKIQQARDQVAVADRNEPLTT